MKERKKSQTALVWQSTMATKLCYDIIKTLVYICKKNAQTERLKDAIKVPACFWECIWEESSVDKYKEKAPKPELKRGFVGSVAFEAVKIWGLRLWRQWCEEEEDGNLIKVKQAQTVRSKKKKTSKKKPTTKNAIANPAKDWRRGCGTKRAYSICFEPLSTLSKRHKLNLHNKDFLSH